MRSAGLWWWIDRWRKSSAYMDMTLDEQGAYRNLLDEACLRGGPLPNDERILAKACGDALAWPKVKKTVLAKFRLAKDGWRNETLDAIIAESSRRAKKQADYRARQHEHGNESGNDTGNATHNDRRPLDLDLDLLTGSGSGISDLKEPAKKKELASEKGPGRTLALRARFERFWIVYPRKEGKDGAWKAWQKMRPSETFTSELLGALEIQCAQERWTKDDGKYVPAPKRWIVDGRWQDKPKINGSRFITAHVALICPDVPPCPAGTTSHDCTKRTALIAGRQRA